MCGQDLISRCQVQSAWRDLKYSLLCTIPTAVEALYYSGGGAILGLPFWLRAHVRLPRVALCTSFTVRTLGGPKAVKTAFYTMTPERESQIGLV